MNRGQREEPEWEYLRELGPSVADALRDRTRRRVIAELATDEGPWTLGDVAGRIEQRGANGGDRVRIELHHRHLPKLDAAGLVTYDYEDHTVEITPLGADCASALGVSAN